jgi:hypothetical protein
VLIGTFIVIVCLEALRVSYRRFVIQRDKKGKVGRMRRMKVGIGGRSAASLAVTYSALAECLKLSGGSG